jgi:peptidoglycan/LPS O-acetylase OafA/YrhL
VEVRAGPVRIAPRDGDRPAVPNAPGLDGLRGLAVLAVLAYHLDLVWAGGGFLGVEVFFTLSGFLITQLLVAELRRSGTVDVGAFVRARARRLLPALVVCVTAVVLTYRLVLPADVPSLRWDALRAVPRRRGARAPRRPRGAGRGRGVRSRSARAPRPARPDAAGAGGGGRHPPMRR